MFLNFDNNYNQTNINHNFGKEDKEDCEPNELNLIDNSSIGVLNPFIDNDNYYSETNQSKCLSGMDIILLSPHNIFESFNFNEKIIDKEEIKDKKNKTNSNVKISDTHSVETLKSTIKKKNKTIDTTNKNKNKNKKRIDIDNRIRQAKIVIINVIIKYINNQILKEYQNKINTRSISILKKIHSSQISCAKKEFNINLLNETIKEIISLKINGKYSSSPSNINLITVNYLLGEKDEKKRKIFNYLLNKTFREWINELKDPNDELKMIYKKQLKTKKNEKVLENVIQNFENILEKKRKRIIK